MKSRTALGWIFVGIGTMFLICGLFVLVFITTATVSGEMADELPQVGTSIWVTIADRVMDFTIRLLEVTWTPTRVGIFLIVVGLVFEAGGAYLIASTTSAARS